MQNKYVDEALLMMLKKSSERDTILDEIRKLIVKK